MSMKRAVANGIGMGLLVIANACGDLNGDGRVQVLERNGGSLEACMRNMREMESGRFQNGGEMEYCLSVLVEPGQ